jgi:hypothetical protein
MTDETIALRATVIGENSKSRHRVENGDGFSMEAGGRQSVRSLFLTTRLTSASC